MEMIYFSLSHLIKLVGFYLLSNEVIILISSLTSLKYSITCFVNTAFLIPFDYVVFANKRGFSSMRFSCLSSNCENFLMSLLIQCFSRKSITPFI